jgi:uncharacterized protein YjbI with pentapeptide repeats
MNFRDLRRRLDAWLDAPAGSRPRPRPRARLEQDDVTKRLQRHIAWLQGSMGSSEVQADFRNEDVSGRDLRQPLDATQFASVLVGGANLRGATVPEGFSWSEVLSQVESRSKNVGGYFVALLAACSYTMLTTMGMSDVAFLTNSATNLPVVNIGLSATSFYLYAPFILLAAYVYFVVEMLRLCERLSELPAVFPDGVSVDHKIYPWVMNSLVRTYMPQLDGYGNPPPAMVGVQSIVCILLAWWMTPFVITCCWLRYLHTHDMVGGMYLCGVSAISLLSAWYGHYLSTLRLKNDARLSSREPSQLYRRGDLEIGFVALSLLGLMITRSATVSVPMRIPGDAGSGDAIVYGGVPSRHVFLPFRYFDMWLQQHVYDSLDLLPFIGAPSIHAGGARISTLPPNWPGSSAREKDCAAVIGANLADCNLRHAYLKSAFLVRADLSGADLTLADLSKADLRKATVRNSELSADLSGARLTWADLSGTDLAKAILNHAEINDANLAGVILTDAQMRGAHLTYTRLEHADLSGAHLSGADLRHADLTDADLPGAHLSGADLRHADLTDTDLTDADLSSADLRLADLHRADLKGANLRRADLRDTDLHNCSDLKQLQIDAAITNSRTKVPKGFKVDTRPFKIQEDKMLD